MEDQDLKPILFGPKNKKSLKKLYPEIDEDPVFKGIEGRDLLFAWYIGIPHSPIDADWNDSVRHKNAAAICFEEGEKRHAYGSGDFPDEIKFAIDRFRKYSPEARAAAKNIVQKIFTNFEKLVNVDVEKDFLIKRKVGKGEDAEEVTEMDWTGRKQYVDSVTTISKTLPDLLKQVEEGFGISDKKADEISGVRSIDRYHQNKKSNSLQP
jgi:hypothetical protein